MTPAERCQWCDTVLVFTSDGLRMTFKAHDDAFCRDATRQRVKDLERALQAAAETFEYATRMHRQSVEERVQRMFGNEGLRRWNEREVTAADVAAIWCARLDGDL